MEGLLIFYASFLLFFISNPLLVESQIKQVVEREKSIDVQTYIVHVAHPEGSSELLGQQELEDWHRSFLPRTALQSGKSRLVYSYSHAISGFAARLTPPELEAMKTMDGFLHAEPGRTYKLATTYTPAFLGLSRSNGAWSSSNGEGIIIGVLDTGILPTHDSFNDAGMPPPPPTWKARCEFLNFSCNNKIIGGAQFDTGDNKPPPPMLDRHGHGTHVASTAAGSFVTAANVLGAANGTASGVAPKAHLAIYKIGNGAMTDVDILAAIDQAIKDGVDVLSMSFGNPKEAPFFSDSIAIGSLAAIKHGIIPVAAAANAGPSAQTLSNSAPWLIIAGASTTDRRVISVVKLGNGVELYGESAYQPPSFDSSVMMPTIFPSQDENSKRCLEGSLDHLDVKGKLVICVGGGNDNVDKGKVVLAAGGAAMILIGHRSSPEPHVLPASHVSSSDGRIIVDYVKGNPSPMAAIAFKGTQFGHRPTPALPYFSSRGPSTFNGGILKPDVLAPGVNILAASPFSVGPSPAGHDFQFQSGTSMATPHLSGVAALVKSKHRGWSPAAIHSAIVTTAHDSDLDGNLIIDETTGKTADISAIGAGQVDPSAALDPGLVYDLNPDDYTGYLCGGYHDLDVSIIVRRSINCSLIVKLQPWQLNYPSIGVTFGPGFTSTQFTRTVTNVGKPYSAYTAKVTEPVGVSVRLSRHVIRFRKGHPTATFTVNVTLTASIANITELATFRGKLQFVSRKHVVTSPIAILYRP